MTAFNEIVGTSGNDWLDGTNGADRIVGNGGADEAWGNGGADVFVVDRDLYSNDSWRDRMTIHDFQVGVDKLELKGSAADYTFHDGYLETAQGEVIAFLAGIDSLDLVNDVIYSDGGSTGGGSTGGGNTGGGGTGGGSTGGGSTGGTFNDIVGTTGNDYLQGTSGADRINGLDGVDTLAGGAGGDIFVLGDKTGSFYADQGYGDYADITDFKVGEDIIQLAGSVDDYTFRSENGGTWIFKGDAHSQELVADVFNTSVNDVINSLQFVGGGSGHPGGGNTDPDAVNDFVSTQVGTPIKIDVLGNDVDADGDTLSLKQIMGNPVNGTAQIVNGQVLYTPNAGFVGNDTFAYQISDGNGGHDVAQVTVNINPGSNSDPNANNDFATTGLNTPVAINVLGNDSDPEGDALSVTSINGVSVNPGTVIDVGNGTATLLNNGQISFNPDSDFTGTETFSYHVSDGNGGEDTANVTVDVTQPLPTSGTIVGADSIRERSTETYKIQLDQAVSEDTFVTVRIKDGTAQQTDESTVFEYVIPDSYFNQSNNYYNPVPEYTRNFFNSGFSQGDTIQWYAPNQETLDFVRTYWYDDDGYDSPANSHTPANASGVYNGVDALVNDFRVFNPNGDIVTGDTFTVRVSAGSNMSEEFEVLANHEINLGETVIGYFDTEATETFSIHVESIGGVAATGDLEIDILDKKANVSPIAFDLNGDGIQTLSINEGVTFDMLKTGTAVNTGWLSGEDGFLAVDNDGDGLITSRAELFGGTVGEGFAKLETFDSNGDGLVNESDDLFADLRLWQDANENGVTDSGELISLTTAGISDLVTSYTDVFITDAAGNIHGEHSSAKKNGSSIDMVDVYFQVQA